MTRCRCRPIRFFEARSPNFAAIRVGYPVHGQVLILGEDAIRGSDRDLGVDEVLTRPPHVCVQPAVADPPRVALTMADNSGDLKRLNLSGLVRPVSP